jgi:F-box domain
MISTAHRNGGSTGGATLLDQLPPDQLPLRLVLQYLSPKDVVAFQSTCRSLYQTIGLAPLNPPRPCLRLASHPMGFITHNEYFRICPFFTSTPKNLRRVHSCQVSVVYSASEICRFRVVACQAPSNADDGTPLWNPITIAESGDIFPSDFSRTTLAFAPVGDGVVANGSAKIKYYLVACSLQLSVKTVSVCTFLFDNTACAVFNRSQAGGEPHTSELRRQYQAVLSRPIYSVFPPSFLADFAVCSSADSEYGNCVEYMILLRDVKEMNSEPVEEAPSLFSLPRDCSNNLAGLGILLRACRTLRAPRLPCEARSVNSWRKVFSWSLAELFGLPARMFFVIDTIACLSSSRLGLSLGISKHDLLALETILLAAIDEQHDFLEDTDFSSVCNSDRLRDARNASRQLREKAHRSLDDVDQQVSKWFLVDMAIAGVLELTKSVAIGRVVGSSLALLRSATRLKR